MAMRETKRSLRTYLMVVGVLSGVLGATMLRTDLGMPFLLLTVTGLLLSVGYILCALNFTRLLVESPGVIITVLCLGEVEYVAVSLWVYTLTQDVQALVRPLIGALILLYLLVNVIRLSKQERIKAEVARQGQGDDEDWTSLSESRSRERP